MGRRGFLGMLAALVVAPVAAAQEPGASVPTLTAWPGVHVGAETFTGTINNAVFIPHAIEDEQLAAIFESALLDMPPDEAKQAVEEILAAPVVPGRKVHG